MLSRDEGETSGSDVASIFGANVWGWSVPNATPVPEVTSAPSHEVQAASRGEGRDTPDNDQACSQGHFEPVPVVQSADP